MGGRININTAISNCSFAQSGQISGVVLDGSNNEGLPSVTIRVKGTQKGTTTDVSGNFKIEAAKSDVLVFSYIGFKTQEVVVGNQTTLKIALAIDDLTQLSEVVVVGYGTQRKEAVTGSVISVSGDKIREIPAPNISQALQGRMPGVEMSQTSTKPGATMQIRIREPGL